MIVTCPTCGVGVDVPHAPEGKAVCCPACGGIFTPTAARGSPAGADSSAPPLAAAPAPAPQSNDPAPWFFPPLTDLPVDLANARDPWPALPQAHAPSGAASLDQLAAEPELPVEGLLPQPASGDPTTDPAALAMSELTGAGAESLDAAGDPGPAVEPRFDGWYLEIGEDLVGPLTSREVALRAYREQISRETILFHPGKNVRIAAGRVPLLFRRKRSDGGNGSLDPHEPVWLVEAAGKTVGPLSTRQIERAAKEGILLPESILSFPAKQIRVVARDVPRLFRSESDSAADAPSTQAGPGQEAQPQAAPDPNDPLAALREALQSRDGH